MKKTVFLHIQESHDFNQITCPFLQTETALIYDAIKLMATALQDLDQSRSIDVVPISCGENGTPWTHGSSLINYMRPITFQGKAFVSDFGVQLIINRSCCS